MDILILWSLSCNSRCRCTAGLIMNIDTQSEMRRVLMQMRMQNSQALFKDEDKGRVRKEKKRKNTDGPASIYFNKGSVTWSECLGLLVRLPTSLQHQRFFYFICMDYVSWMLSLTPSLPRAVTLGRWHNLSQRWYLMTSELFSRMVETAMQTFFLKKKPPSIHTLWMNLVSPKHFPVKEFPVSM